MRICLGSNVLATDENPDFTHSTTSNNIGLNLISKHTWCVSTACKIMLDSALVHQNHTGALLLVYFYDVVTQNGNLTVVVGVE